MPLPEGGGASTGGGGTSSGGGGGGLSAEDIANALNDKGGGGGGGASSGTTSSSGSSSSGGSSSGGGGGSAGPSKEVLANAIAAYANMLRSWGIPITPQMKRFILHAAQTGMSSSLFLQQLRRTKDYAAAFKGIMRGNGTLRMSEAQYIAGYQQARDAAAAVGRNFSRDMYGKALKNNNSPSELKAKIEAIDTLKSDPTTFQNFNEYLLAKGVIKKPLDKKELATFLMRQGPPQFEQEWNTAAQAAQLERMAIDVGKPKTGSDVSYKELKKLQKNLPPGEQPDYSGLAQALKALPASTLYGYGLTKKKLLDLAYGAPGAEQVAEVATRALAQYRTAVTEPTAQSQLAQSQTGTQILTGRRPQQASE